MSVPHLQTQEADSAMSVPHAQAGFAMLVLDTTYPECAVWRCALFVVIVLARVKLGKCVSGSGWDSSIHH
eukprot:3938590-Rhodomonas_salina.2